MSTEQEAAQAVAAKVGVSKEHPNFKPQRVEVSGNEQKQRDRLAVLEDFEARIPKSRLSRMQRIRLFLSRPFYWFADKLAGGEGIQKLKDERIWKMAREISVKLMRGQTSDWKGEPPRFTYPTNPLDIISEDDQPPSVIMGSEEAYKDNFTKTIQDRLTYLLGKEQQSEAEKEEIKGILELYQDSIVVVKKGVDSKKRNIVIDLDKLGISLDKLGITSAEQKEISDAFNKQSGETK